MLQTAFVTVVARQELFADSGFVTPGKDTDISFFTAEEELLEPQAVLLE